MLETWTRAYHLVVVCKLGLARTQCAVASIYLRCGQTELAHAGPERAMAEGPVDPSDGGIG